MAWQRCAASFSADDSMKPYRHHAFIRTLFLLSISVLAAADKAEALQFRLRWVDASKNETGFKIERKRNNGKHVRIATLAANVTSYVDTTVAPGAAYCYRVRAFNAKGSAASNPACGTTRADLTISKAGTGAGTVVSSPAGINCGSKCKANYPGLTVITLTPTPAAGSVFSGWSGAKDCKNSSVTLNADIQCVANFQKIVAPLVANRSTTPNPVNLASAAKIAPNPANPAPIAKNNSAATATQPLAVSIGVFRPSTGEWLLDLDGNDLWNGCSIDECSDNFGGAGDLPVVGSWGNALKTLVGFFDSQTARWYLDFNGNGILDGCETSACRYLYGQPGDRPVAGDWTGNGKTRIGVFRPSTGKWYFDLNGNGVLDSCTVDRCLTFGASGDLPVTGDWTGSGITEMGIFRPGTRQWFLITSAPEKLPGCTDSPCVYTFGSAGDLPVVGDWDESGRDKIGIFRPTTGEWLLDLDGDGKWEGCSVDECSGPFGQSGDLPIVGQW